MEWTFNRFRQLGRRKLSRPCAECLEGWIFYALRWKKPLFVEKAHEDVDIALIRGDFSTNDSLQKDIRVRNTDAMCPQKSTLKNRKRSSLLKQQVSHLADQTNIFFDTRDVWPKLIYSRKNAEY